MSVWSKLFEWNLWVLVAFWWVFGVLVLAQVPIWICLGIRLVSSIPIIVVLVATIFPVVAMSLGARMGP